MSSKPKASEYKASEAEKTQASVAQAEKNYFNENYAPLLREMRDQSMQEDLGWCSAWRCRCRYYAIINRQANFIWRKISR